VDQIEFGNVSSNVTSLSSRVSERTFISNAFVWIVNSVI
jgi:hypothetical protein